MTVKNPAIFLQAGSHPAEDVRRAFDVFVGAGSEGYVTTGDLLVAESGTPDMGVQIAGGRALIQGTESTYSGVYMVLLLRLTCLTLALILCVRRLRILRTRALLMRGVLA